MFCFKAFHSLSLRTFSAGPILIWPQLNIFHHTNHVALSNESSDTFVAEVQNVLLFVVSITEGRPHKIRPWILRSTFRFQHCHPSDIRFLFLSAVSDNIFFYNTWCHHRMNVTAVITIYLLCIIVEIIIFLIGWWSHPDFVSSDVSCHQHIIFHTMTWPVCLKKLDVCSILNGNIRCAWLFNELLHS